MNLIKMTPNDNCLIVSFYMVLCHYKNIIYDRNRLLEDFTHTGMEFVGTCCSRRGFHIQEIIDACIQNGLFCTLIEKFPLNEYENGEVIQVQSRGACLDRFKDYLYNYSGILITDSHAMAWDKEFVYDPIGMVTNKMDFDFQDVKEILIINR